MKIPCPATTLLILTLLVTPVAPKLSLAIFGTVGSVVAGKVLVDKLTAGFDIEPDLKK